MGILYLSCVSGGDLINDGADSLKRLRDKIVQKSDEKAPSFLLVLTAVGDAYKREDGVYQLLSAEDILEIAQLVSNRLAIGLRSFL